MKNQTPGRLKDRRQSEKKRAQNGQGGGAGAVDPAPLKDVGDFSDYTLESIREDYELQEALHVFHEEFQRIKLQPLEMGQARMRGLFAMTKHHPKLKPLTDALRQIVEGDARITALTSLWYAV